MTAATAADVAVVRVVGAVTTTVAGHADTADRRGQGTATAAAAADDG